MTEEPESPGEETAPEPEVDDFEERVREIATAVVKELGLTSKVEPAKDEPEQPRQTMRQEEFSMETLVSKVAAELKGREKTKPKPKPRAEIESKPGGGGWREKMWK